MSFVSEDYMPLHEDFSTRTEKWRIDRIEMWKTVGAGYNPTLGYWKEFGAGIESRIGAQEVWEIILHSGGLPVEICVICNECSWHTQFKAGYVSRLT